MSGAGAEAFHEVEPAGCRGKTEAQFHPACLIALLVVVLVGFSVRTAGIQTQSIWRDEADSLDFAASLPFLGRMFISPGHNAPLYYLLLRGWSQIAGWDLFPARFLSVLAGTVSIAGLWAVGRKLVGPAAALAAAAVAATSPLLVWYSQEARTYSLLVASTLLSVWLLLEARSQGRLALWLAYALNAASSLYLHLTALLMLPFYVVLNVGTPTGRRIRWQSVTLAVALLTIVTVPLVIWEVRLLVAPFQTGHRAVSAGEMAAGLVRSMTVGVSSTMPAWASLPIIGLALIGVGSPWMVTSRRRILSPHAVGLLLMWLLVPPTVLALISADMPVYSERYLIFIAPAFYLFVGAGVITLAKVWPPVGWIMGSLVLLVHGVGLGAQATQIIKPDIRGVAKYIAAEHVAGDLVLFLIPHNQGAFERMAPFTDVRYAGAPYANRFRDMRDIDTQMKEIVAESRRVWLVESEPELWDRSGLVRLWLQTHAASYEERIFHQIRVTRYEDVKE